LRHTFFDLYIANINDNYTIETMGQSEEIYIVGDIRYSEVAAILYESKDLQEPQQFLLALQKLMKKYSVVKIDVAIDAHKLIANCKHQ